jgi:hypothetical protein
MRTTAAASRDAEYASGRYQDEPRASFAYDVNLIPMSHAGPDLIGLATTQASMTLPAARDPEYASGRPEC